MTGAVCRFGQTPRARGRRLRERANPPASTRGEDRWPATRSPRLPNRWTRPSITSLGSTAKRRATPTPRGTPCSRSISLVRSTRIECAALTGRATLRFAREMQLPAAPIGSSSGSAGTDRLGRSAAAFNARHSPDSEPVLDGSTDAASGPRSPQRVPRPNQRARRLVPNSAFSRAVCADGAVNVPVGWPGVEKKSTSTRATCRSPNSIQHEPVPSYPGGSLSPRIRAIRSSATTRAAPSANTPALGVPTLVLAAEFDSLCGEDLQPFSQWGSDAIRARIDAAFEHALGLPSLNVVRGLLAREPVVGLIPLV